jgi:hypothetical protein
MSSEALNTNILGTENTVGIIAQDMGAHMVADAAIHTTLTKGITKGAKSIGIKQVKFTSKAGKVVFKMLVSVKNQAKLATILLRRVKQRITTVIKSGAKKVIAAAAKKVGQTVAKKVATKTAVKVAQKAGVAAGKSALQKIAVGATTCAATAGATLGIGCVVSAAITALMLAFDVFNLIMSLIDSTGITILINKKDIDDMAMTLRNQFLEDKSGDESYLEDEIFFDPLLFVFDTDPKTQELIVDPVWGKRYNDLQDEYMKSIGITGDWRTRVEAAQFEQPEPTPAAAKARDEKEKKKTTTNRNIIIGVIIAVVILIVLLLLVV